MDAERAYDFKGTHLPIYHGFVGHVTKMVWRERQRVVPFGPGLALAQPLVVAYPIGGDEHVLDLEIGVSHGRPACLSMRSAHGEPLTGALVRSIPIAEIVNSVAAANTYRVFRTKRGRYIGAYYSDAFEGMLGFEKDLKELRAEVESKRRTVDDAFLATVASLYREAVANGHPPAKVIQEELGPTTRENARRWIMRAREAGKLGAAAGVGRAGEVSPAPAGGA